MKKRLIQFGIVLFFSLISIVSFGYCNYNNIRVSYDGTVDVCNSDLSDCYSFPGGGEDYEELVFNFDGLITPSPSDSLYDYNIFLNTGELLSGYILESEINNFYCEDHGYCPLINTGEIIGTGDNWSALFINEIQHPSAPLINITIPEEFDWSYTGNEEQFDLSISGYNVDTDYIEGIIQNQKTLPNDKDFNNIITGLIPLFVPGLCIILLLVFIFRFIKKIF